MAPVLVQSAFNSVAKYQSRYCTATFNKPTTPGSLIVVVATYAGALPVGLPDPDGFTRVADLGLRDLEMGVWYRENAPETSSVTVSYGPLTMRSIQLRVMEYAGVAQANALDRVVIKSDEDNDVYAGNTGNSAQGDSLVLGFVCNQYASTAQSGFSGDLTRLFESVSPLYYGWFGSNEDWERSRLTIHQAIGNTIAAYTLSAILSTWRRWLSVLVVFKGGSSGPVKMTSKNAPPTITMGGRGSVTVFGPLLSKEAPPTITIGSLQARIAPSNYQYRLGGWSGYLIGSGAPVTVESTDGLGGFQVRTSDDDLPRGDGALRGIDLESARQIAFTVNVGTGRDEVERNMDDLYRALIPQRDTDWELIWRHPTQVLKMMRVRPIDMTRKRDSSQLFSAKQSFVLRAADPRHYSAVEHEEEIDVTPDLGDPVYTKVVNIGNIAAYPIITVKGPAYGPPVTRIELVNATALVTFDVRLTLAADATLVGDMDARITGAPRSVITLDGQTKYGSWQLPRDPFRINADPNGKGGFNQIYLRTTPAGAPVTCTLRYRDTWSG